MPTTEKKKENRIIVTVDWDGCLYDNDDYGDIKLRPGTICAIKDGREKHNMVFIVRVPKTVKYGTVEESLRKYDIDYAFLNQNPKTVAGVFGPDVNCILLEWNTPEDIYRSQFAVASKRLGDDVVGPAVVAMEAADACSVLAKRLNSLAGNGLIHVSEEELAKLMASAYLYIHAVETTYGVDRVLPDVLAKMSMDIINR